MLHLPNRGFSNNPNFIYKDIVYNLEWRGWEGTRYIYQTEDLVTIHILYTRTSCKTWNGEDGRGHATSTKQRI